MNDLDRFQLVIDVIDRVPAFGLLAAYAKQAIRDKLSENQRLNPLRSQRLRVEKIASGDSELEMGHYQVICGRKYRSIFPRI